MPSSDIILDRESFKALASDTRITLLKVLAERKHTLAELSTRLGMSHPSVKEHLDSLVRAGLVERFDEGRKWKYYGLTKKGKGILFPEQRTILVLLGISLLSAGAFIARWVSSASFGSASLARESLLSAVAPVQDSVVLKEIMDAGASSTGVVLNSSVAIENSSAMTLDWVLVILGVVFAVGVLGALYVWVKRKRW